mmetsp:Transcript_80460/g.93893  ORF Transcript_80460/g.93893 Transcript_80460/m.93893 type:complete len:80 (-) Transcript_80460:127-366(-)
MQRYSTLSYCKRRLQFHFLSTSHQARKPKPSASALYFTKNDGKGIASLLGSNSVNGRANSSYSETDMKLVPFASFSCSL